jgi:predicted nuclease of restriction endonuclease-like (RecB) superfamily
MLFVNGVYFMENDKYYVEIEHIIKKNEINKTRRILEDNYDTLTNYWNIGRLIVEAQGGSSRAKYGNELIKKWSETFTEKYGKGYDSTTLRKFRQFYLIFPKCATVWRISWSQIRELLPINDENKRNYYINLCIKNNLSVRELIKEIKNNSYERLLEKPEHIEIISNSNKYSITSSMKNPIIIELKENEKINSEYDLEVKLLSELEFFFQQLGDGFTLVGSQYKISCNNKDYYIDILLFNYITNTFIVVELKIRELRKEDKAQVVFYMELVDKQIRQPFHNKTIGIIISKEQDKYIANFVGSSNIIPLTYQISK